MGLPVRRPAMVLHPLLRGYRRLLGAAWTPISGGADSPSSGRPLPIRGDVTPICARWRRTGRQLDSTRWSRGHSDRLTHGSFRWGGRARRLMDDSWLSAAWHINPGRHRSQHRVGLRSTWMGSQNGGWRGHSVRKQVPALLNRWPQLSPPCPGFPRLTCRPPARAYSLI